MGCVADRKTLVPKNTVSMPQCSSSPQGWWKSKEWSWILMLACAGCRYEGHFGPRKRLLWGAKNIEVGGTAARRAPPGLVRRGVAVLRSSVRRVGQTR